MNTDTEAQYRSALLECKDIYLKKIHDYGSAWRILRSSSLTDQLYIKAKRIRTIEQKHVQLVDEDVADEFKAIVNYGIMALIQLELPETTSVDLSAADAEERYDHFAAQALQLMQRKNHDYGEAWRDMRLSSLTDLILMKILRVKQIEDLDGEVLASEGRDANYYDMINYSLFALILLKQEGQA